MTIYNGDNSAEVRRLQKALAYWATFDPEQGPRIERAVADIERRLELLGEPPPALLRDVPREEWYDPSDPDVEDALLADE